MANARSAAAPVGSVDNGVSIQGQTVTAVVAAVCETRDPVDHEDHRRRCEFSEEEFERRQALVKQESFLT
jgi:hypothetical protein